MTAFLMTERLVLRPFVAGDAELLFALNSDPEVMRFIDGGVPPSRRAILERTMPRVLREFPCIGTRGYWAAELRADGAFLGWFQFQPLDEHDPAVVELGYRLGRVAWGRGLATEGSRALIRKGFTELGVQRVIASTMTDNTAYRRVMEKSGLYLTGPYHEPLSQTVTGLEHGAVRYELTNQQWSRGLRRS